MKKLLLILLCAACVSVTDAGTTFSRISNPIITQEVANQMLLDAAASGDEEAVKTALGNHANIEATDHGDWTPLHWAARNGHTAIVQLLLEHGANTNATAHNGFTPLHGAARNGQTAIVQLLLKYGANMDIEAANQMLLAAAKSGDEEAVTTAIGNHANIEATTHDGWTPMHWAACKGHIAIVQFLLEHGANIEATDPLDWTPLHYAARNGHTATVQLLLDRGTNIIEATTHDGSTPLHVAACLGHTATVQLLIEHGANIEATDHTGFTPLLWAACKGHTATVQLLIEHGANIEATDHNGWTPLHWAAVRNNDEAETCLKQFMVFKQNIAIFNNALINQKNGSTEIAELSKKFDTEQLPCPSLNQLLRWSITVSNITACKVLLSNGANPLAEQNGYNALILAIALENIAQIKINKIKDTTDVNAIQTLDTELEERQQIIELIYNQNSIKNALWNMLYTGIEKFLDTSKLPVTKENCAIGLAFISTLTTNSLLKQIVRYANPNTIAELIERMAPALIDDNKN